MVHYWKSTAGANPHCAHGPTLLFSRGLHDRKFFACSAFRQRKLCSFFSWADEHLSDSKRMHFDEERSALMKKAYDYEQVRLQAKSDKKIYYCYTCEIISPGNMFGEHNGHVITSDRKLLANPSELLTAKKHSKAESQYYFAPDTVKFLSSVVSRNQSYATLCIGCPRIHEYLCNVMNRPSFLLDFDLRYHQFHGPEKYQWFNMFNCFMFRNNGWEYVRHFCSGKIVSVVIDPPFGGHIDALADTLKQLKSFVNNKLEMYLISPYFMESIIVNCLSELRMSDYKVEYVNHKKFRAAENGKKKNGSPVRIFTNVNLQSIELPKTDYRYCEFCSKWVNIDNKHCFKCDACTSKNGGVYKHCDTCKKCVKATWQHCKTCQCCMLQPHTCSTTSGPASTKRADLKKVRQERRYTKSKKLSQRMRKTKLRRHK